MSQGLSLALAISLGFPPSSALAQNSRRVIRQDLTVQGSTATTGAIGTAQVINANGGLSTVSVATTLPGTTGLVFATASTATTSASTSSGNNSALGIAAGAALIGAILGSAGKSGNSGASSGGNNSGGGGSGGSGGTGSGSDGGNGSGEAGSSGGSGGSDSGSGAGETGSGGSGNDTKADAAAGDSSAPLPEDTQIEGRDCSSTTKTWQPPTKEKFRVTSCYGYRRSSKRNHNGVDFVAEGGEQINPVAPGRIVKAGDAGGYGCQIIIEHDSCPGAVGGNKCYSQYAHLKMQNGRCPAAGKVGQAVNPCTRLAKMGNTGASEGPHLHFEVRTGMDSSTSRNPVTQFKEWRAHKNYEHDKSSCGTVGDGKAPSTIQAPSKKGTS